MIARQASTRLRPVRRGFNLIEMLIALAITAALLTATMVALDASFRAYQSTTEVASTHTIGRLALHRMLTLIRSGTDFGPFPVNPNESIVESNFIEFSTPAGQIVTLQWEEDDQALYVIVVDESSGVEIANQILLEGVTQIDPESGDTIWPFTMEYERGRRLYRATIDLTIVPDDNMSLEMEGDNTDVIRLVASAMPRREVYQ